VGMTKKRIRMKMIPPFRAMAYLGRSGVAFIAFELTD